jgi:hypothetical protein
LGVFLDVDDAEGDAGEDVAADGDLEGEEAGFFEAEGLEVEDHVAGDEVGAFSEFDVDGGFEGLHGVVAVLVDEADGQLVAAFVGLAEADAQREGGGGVDHGEDAGSDRVESSEDAQLRVVVHGGVTKGCYLNIHRGAKILGYGGLQRLFGGRIGG